MREAERVILEEELRAQGGSFPKAAAALGVSVAAMRQKLRRLRNVSVSADVPTLAYEEDQPLAFVVRKEGDRYALGACWTKEQIYGDASSASTLAMVGGESLARSIMQRVNTKIGIDAASQRLNGSAAKGGNHGRPGRGPRSSTRFSEPASARG